MEILRKHPDIGITRLKLLVNQSLPAKHLLSTADTRKVHGHATARLNGLCCIGRESPATTQALNLLFALSAYTRALGGISDLDAAPVLSISIYQLQKWLAQYVPGIKIYDHDTIVKALRPYCHNPRRKPRRKDGQLREYQMTRLFDSELIGAVRGSKWALIEGDKLSRGVRTVYYVNKLYEDNRNQVTGRAIAAYVQAMQAHKFMGMATSGFYGRDGHVATVRRTRSMRRFLSSLPAIMKYYIEDALGYHRRNRGGHSRKAMGLGPQALRYLGDILEKRAYSRGRSGKYKAWGRAFKIDGYTTLQFNENLLAELSKFADLDQLLDTCGDLADHLSDHHDVEDVSDLSPMQQLELCRIGYFSPA